MDMSAIEVKYYYCYYSFSINVSYLQDGRLFETTACLYNISA